MGNAKQEKARLTRREQRTAKPKLHPRSLARSVAKANGFGEEWRILIAALPKQGQKYLHPERRRKEVRA